MAQYVLNLTKEEQGLLLKAVEEENYHNADNHRRTQRLPVPTPLRTVTADQMLELMVKRHLRDIEDGLRHPAPLRKVLPVMEQRDPADLGPK